MNNRTDPKYQEMVLKQKSQDDPKEVAIRNKIRDLVLREPWAREAFENIHQMQIEFLRTAAQNIANPNFVHDEAQAVLGEIADEVRSEIVEGKELLSKIPKGSPVIIATNHFGAYKLLGIDPKKDLGVDIPGYDSMYPYLMYFAALKPVTDALGDNLYYSSNDFPGVFGEIHSAAGFIHVPALAESKTGALIEQTRQALEKHPNAGIVVFPEGTTSGKPSGNGPYHQEPYKTGGYVVAAELGVHILPIAQYFDPQKGYQLKVFEPFVPEKGTKETFAAYAEKNRAEIQAWFDERLAN